MNKHLIAIFIGVLTLFIYFGIATKWSFTPPWTRDYFNPLAVSLRQFHFDIVSPVDTYDLVFFENKWYVPWGILPSVVLIPMQMIVGHYVPTLYTGILFASFNTVLLCLLFDRLRREFFNDMKDGDVLWLYAFALFGTTHAYVGTLGSIWHVSQMVSAFFMTLGIFSIFKKDRRILDYILSFAAFSVTLLGRPTNFSMIILPLSFLIWDIFLNEKRKKFLFAISFKNIVSIGVFPLLCLIFFFFYNWIRFHNPLEYGYAYIHESPYLALFREKYGVMSLRHVLRNIWFMFFEMPALSWQSGPKLSINLIGNSIFFLSPPFFSLFQAKPWNRIKNKTVVDPYVLILWCSLIVGLVPILMFYSTGWMQFGYRYSLDILDVLLLLSFFGIRGHLTFLYKAGIVWAIVLHMIGIVLLQ